MRKETPKRFVSSNASTASNANFQVTLDFSKGPRGAVQIKNRPPTATYSKSSAKPKRTL